MGTIVRAICGYLFLLCVVRLISRRPGGQMTPFELILIFLFGGVTIQAIVADDRSITNAFLAVIAISLMHVTIAALKHHFAPVGRVVDGVPLVLLDHGEFIRENMDQLRVQETDIMAAARGKGLERLEQVKYAILERNGSISIIQNEPGHENKAEEEHREAA